MGSTKSNLKGIAEYVVASITDGLGYAPHPQSRLMQMASTLRNSVGDIPPTNDSFPIVLEAYRDFTLLNYVFDNLKDWKRNPKVVERVRKLISDSVLPQSDRKKSPGRDTQFEIFVFAVCRSARLTPTFFAEPDVVCTVNRRKLGIAAKRLKSVNKFIDRIREGKDQIQNSGNPGIIAIDTCIALNQDNIPIPPMGDYKYSSTHKEYLRGFIERHYKRINEICGGTAVRGLVIHDSNMRNSINKEWQLSSFHFFVPVHDGTKRAAKDFRCFQDRYNGGIPNNSRVP